MLIRARRFIEPVLEVDWMILSDLHLGSGNCSIQALLNCVRMIRCNRRYQNGDIAHSLKRLENQQRLAKMGHLEYFLEIEQQQEEGVEDIWITGNHDPLPQPVGSKLFGMRIERQAVIILVTGQKILVIHGQQFDRSMPLEPIGNAFYELGLGLDYVLNSGARFLGRRTRLSVSDLVKRKVHWASSHLGNFRENGIEYARVRGFDGIFCGHKHHGELAIVDDDFMLYGNTGTFAGYPCTAIVGHYNGDISLTYWDDDGYVAQLTRTITAEQLAHAYDVRKGGRVLEPVLEAARA